LERDQKGSFQVRKVMSNFFSLEDARVDLLLWMAGREKSDCSNQPNLPVLLTSPVLSEVLDGDYETTDIELAV
jgi:hypothetical protein